MHKVVHCENMYNVQLSRQILFSQLHVRSFKSFGAAVERTHTVRVSLAYLAIFYPYSFCWVGV